MYSDTEYAFTVEYAESLGVNCKELEFTQLRFAEETFDAIEEWATSTNEIAPTPPGVKAQVLRTAAGKLPPSADQLTFSGVVFADAYHRIWDPAKLLAQLREKLPKSGWVVVLDRNGPAGEARRVAGHRRHIAPALVREDFARAGFELVSELKPPAPDRFLLRFRVRGG